MVYIHMYCALHVIRTHVICGRYYIYGSKGKRDTMLVGEILRSNDQYFARCISIERRKPPEDKPVHYRVLESKLLHKGAVWDVVQEKLDYRGETISREFVSHPGAVGVLALNDKNEALLIRQYRHPIRTREWEIPAGMLDLSGESPLDAAKRELSEEVDMCAQTWHTLIDFTLTPGGSNEVMRVYLARELRASQAKFNRKSEEADMEIAWIPMEDLLFSVLTRRVQNPVLMLAALAAHEGLQVQWKYLRDADEPWPVYERLKGLIS